MASFSLLPRYQSTPSRNVFVVQIRPSSSSCALDLPASVLSPSPAAQRHRIPFGRPYRFSKTLLAVSCCRSTAEERSLILPLISRRTEEVSESIVSLCESLRCSGISQSCLEDRDVAGSFRREWRGGCAVERYGVRMARRYLRSDEMD